MSSDSTNDSFLPQHATLQERWLAIRRNAEAWYERQSQGQSTRLGDILLTQGSITIPNENCVQDDSIVDAILDWCRNRDYPDSYILWYLDSEPPSPSLTARLLARGVSTNWEAHWMWCDLAKTSSSSPVSSKFNVQISDTVKLEASQQLLEPEPNSKTGAKVLSTLWHLAAYDDETELGTVVLNMTTGAKGVGGLFDMFVKPEHRRKGVGKALVRASQDLAKHLGVHHMYLNSTNDGESLYQQTGFESMCKSVTWHLRVKFRETTAPSETVVAFLQAIGQGNVQKLDQLSGSVSEEQVRDETINTMTPLQIAVYLKQLGSAAWLLKYGVIPDVISLWDLGLNTEVHRLILEHPEEVNRKQGDNNETPLHTAVSRDDIDLARTLLAAPNINVDATDGVFQSTPLGWANFLKRDKMTLMLLDKQKSFRG